MVVPDDLVVRQSGGELAGQALGDVVGILEVGLVTLGLHAFLAGLLAAHHQVVLEAVMLERTQLVLVTDRADAEVERTAGMGHGVWLQGQVLLGGATLGLEPLDALLLVLQELLEPVDENVDPEFLLPAEVEEGVPRDARLAIREGQPATLETHEAQLVDEERAFDGQRILVGETAPTPLAHELHETTDTRSGLVGGAQDALGEEVDRIGGIERKTAAGFGDVILAGQHQP